MRNNIRMVESVLNEKIMEVNKKTVYGLFCGRVNTKIRNNLKCNMGVITNVQCAYLAGLLYFIFSTW